MKTSKYNMCKYLCSCKIVHVATSMFSLLASQLFFGNQPIDIVCFFLFVFCLFVFLPMTLCHRFEPPRWKTNNVVPNSSDTNWAVQAQKMARSLKFRILKEGLYFPSSENKGADQLHGYREADLRLCFLKCRLLVFS